MNGSSEVRRGDPGGGEGEINNEILIFIFQKKLNLPKEELLHVPTPGIEPGSQP
jgi:hypothetical protein